MKAVFLFYKISQLLARLRHDEPKETRLLDSQLTPSYPNGGCYELQRSSLLVK